MVNRLNTAVNHNKSQVNQQAWRQHPTLYENIAYGIYDFGHNMSKNSIRCEHFLQSTVALEINYSITTYSKFCEHFKGWRQLIQEHLGQRFGDLLQEFLTEMYDHHIGERNGVPYLKALAEAWRSEFYRYSIRSDPFTVMTSTVTYDPRNMTTDEWLTILRIQWEDFKSSLTVMQEFEFNQNKTTSKVVDCKPLGHKPKITPAGEDRVPRIEAKGRDKKIQPKAVAVPPPQQKKAKIEDVRKKPPAHDNTVKYCVGDLLNHYGATQQIACKSPCKYVHYKDIPSGIAKDAVLQRFQGVAPKLELNDATVALMIRKIQADSKFK